MIKKELNWVFDLQILINLSLILLGIGLAIGTYFISIWFTIFLFFLTVYYTFNLYKRFDVIIQSKRLLTEEKITTVHYQKKTPIIRSRIISNSEIQLLDSTYSYNKENMPNEEEEEERWNYDRDSTIID